MYLRTFFACVLACSLAAAHSPSLPHHELTRRDGLAKRCAAQAGQFVQKRQAKRQLAGRQLAERSPAYGTADVQLASPYYDAIQNNTCVLSPEVTAGPYQWPRSQTLRQDMTEGQAGVPLLLDIGVLDMATCEPLPNALLNIWHANATGSYSSFTGLDPNTPFAVVAAALGVTREEYAAGDYDIHTDDGTFLRGMWPTDAEGVMEMKTNFPGFYIGRAVHMHAQVFTNWTLAENGTISTSNVVFTGQLFFEDALTEKIMAVQPYASHNQINRTTNAGDTGGDNGENLVVIMSAGGYSPIVNAVPIDGENLENGIVGYITIGVDTA